MICLDNWNKLEKVYKVNMEIGKVLIVILKMWIIIWIT